MFPMTNHASRGFFGGAVFLLALSLPVRGDDLALKGREQLLAALEPFSGLVGSWRGIAQPRRGSSVGAWQEHAEVVWNWSAKPGEAGLQWTIQDSTFWESARLSHDADSKQFVLTITRPDQSTTRYTGTFENKRLILEAPVNEAGQIGRVTLTLINANRAVWLHERRLDGQKFPVRLVEIGYQRQGTRLATSTSDGPECVVTGGKGTMAVMHEGKTYYVCCSGCRDAFLDDPAGILADWEARNAERKKAAAKP